MSLALFAASSTVAVGVLLTVLWLRWSFVTEDCWSIDFLSGREPLALAARAAGAAPAITAAFVTDIRAGFVADPFLVRTAGRWHLFFEAYEMPARRGILACASSSDGRAWTYGGTVLREPFHLSYPQVVEADGNWYMLPETGAAGAVRLYRAVEFPRRWEFVRELVGTALYDPTLVQHEGRWWLFASDTAHCLHLYGANRLEGPWTEHPASPVVRRDPKRARPAGRILRLDGRLLRFAQDGETTYGSSVRVLAIIRLDDTGYEERELPDSPILSASGQGWNRDGMHHFDAQRGPDGEWLAAVDGNRRRTEWNWRAGARRLERCLKQFAAGRRTGFSS
ncbi:MAG: hypothetical protein ABIT36_12805 [Steroidobacteraceae bacterium]